MVAVVVAIVLLSTSLWLLLESLAPSKDEIEKDLNKILPKRTSKRTRKKLLEYIVKLTGAK